jgi:hypothetical protein
MLFLFFYALNVGAQRWFATNDSKHHDFEDLRTTVGRNQVYLDKNEQLTLIKDFYIVNCQIPEDDIRDFDFIDRNTWLFWLEATIMVSLQCGLKLIL